MAGGTFVLLKGGGAGPESAKQTEIRLANLLKILVIAHNSQSRFKPPGNATPALRGCMLEFPVAMANSG